MQFLHIILPNNPHYCKMTYYCGCTSCWIEARQTHGSKWWAEVLVRVFSQALIYVLHPSRSVLCTCSCLYWSSFETVSMILESPTVQTTTKCWFNGLMESNTRGSEREKQFPRNVRNKFRNPYIVFLFKSNTGLYIFAFPNNLILNTKTKSSAALT